MEVKCSDCIHLSGETCQSKLEQVNVFETRQCYYFETRHGYPLNVEELEEVKEEVELMVEQGEDSFVRYLNTAQDFEDLLIDLKEVYNVKHLDDVIIEFTKESDNNNYYTILYPKVLDFDEEFQIVKHNMMIKKAQRYKEFQRLYKEFGGKD